MINDNCNFTNLQSMSLQVTEGLGKLPKGLKKVTEGLKKKLLG